ncbi:MAG: hypothetical protein K2P81_17840 [Bacteriovoracaceae bacterium]|nr:hypothetical protein [Bacteriovoracaceae bacterium]
MLRILSIIFLMLLASCQFKSSQSPGDLVAGHVSVTEKFTISVPSSSTRVAADVLTFTLTHPYAVTVTGTPRLTLTIGASTAYANYVSGSGTTTLTFTYTVLPGDNDSDGIAVATSVDLNGGTLSYTGTAGAGSCTLTLTVPSTSGIKVDTTGPTVSSLTAPANATYYSGMPVTFTATMSEATTVTGTPRLTLTVGASTKYANYVSGSGTSTLIFSYVPATGEIDGDGITMLAAIDANGGTLQDSVANSATLTFVAPNTTLVLVNGSIPVVSSVTLPSNGTYGSGDILDFILTFSHTVNVVGTPHLSLTIGSTTRLAAYTSGTGTTQLTFRYIIQAGEVDSNGIAVATSLTFGGGESIKSTGNVAMLNFYTVPSSAGILVAENRPVISSFIVNNGTYYIGQSFTFTAVFNSAVTITGTPRIPITLDTGGPIYATYLSGSGTTNITFTATVTSGTDDATGVVITTPIDLNSGTIKNSSNVDANLTFTQPTTASLLVSGTAPTITSITPPANATYVTAQNLDFIVNFSENVTVGNTSNVKLNLTIGVSSIQAAYLSGSGTSAITFRHTITGGNVDTDGIAITSLSVVSTGYITDGTSTANPATLTFTAPNTTGVLVNATTPSISSVTSPANGTYLNAQTMDFVLNYSEAVTVTGTPRLTLTVGSSTAYANYLSGSGTSALTFRYTVASPEVDTDGIACSTTLDNNGGTIQSALGVNASTTVTAQVLTSVLVDGDVPDVISVTPPANSIYDTTDVSFNFSVTFDQAVTVAAGTPRIVLDIGGTTRYATYVSGTGTTTLLFTHTINSADVDLNGITIGNSGNLDLNGATLKDANTNDANLALTSVDLSNVVVTYPNMVAWIDPDDSSTVTSASCGIPTCVSAITDKTGSSYNLTATGSAKPQYLASGFGTGNTASLQFNDSAMQMDFVSPMVNIRTMIIVFENETSQTGNSDLFWNSVGGTNARVQITSAGGWDLSYGGTQTAGYSLNGSALSANATTANTNFVAGSRHILVVRFAANQSPAATQRLGAANFGGKIAEFMVFTSTSLSDAQLSPIINYLNTKHGVY